MMVMNECYECGQVKMDFETKEVFCLLDNHFVTCDDESKCLDDLYGNCPKKELNNFKLSELKKHSYYDY